MGSVVAAASQQQDRWKALAVEIAERTLATHRMALMRLEAMKGLSEDQQARREETEAALRKAIVQWEAIVQQVRNRGRTVGVASSPELLDAPVQVDPEVNLEWLGKQAKGVTENYERLVAKSVACERAVATCVRSIADLPEVGGVLNRAGKWAKRFQARHHSAEKSSEESPVVVARTRSVSIYGAVMDAVVNTLVKLDLFDLPADQRKEGVGLHLEALCGVVSAAFPESRLPPEVRIDLEWLAAFSVKEPARADEIRQCFAEELRSVLGLAEV
jgi:hypothetical protein